MVGREHKHSKGTGRGLVGLEVEGKGYKRRKEEWGWFRRDVTSSEGEEENYMMLWKTCSGARSTVGERD